MAIENNNNKVLNVPVLRFPEFTEDWKSTTIKNACSEFQSGKNIKAEMITCKGLYPVYGGNGLRGFTGSYNHEGDYVLIGRQGALCGNIRKVTGRTYITEHAIAVCASEENDTAFLQYLFQRMKLGQYSDQSAQPGLAVNKLLRLNIKVPSKIEQVKIAKVLSLLDERISTQNKIIEDLKKLKSAIAETLFCTPKESMPAKRVSTYSKEWKLIKLSDICQRVQTKNTGNQCRQVLTIAAQHGLVNQEDFFNKTVASENLEGYYLLQKGDFAYNKSYSGDYTWGAIKRLERYDKGVLSAQGIMDYSIFLSLIFSIPFIAYLIWKNRKSSHNFLIGFHPNCLANNVLYKALRNSGTIYCKKCLYK